MVTHPPDRHKPCSACQAAAVRPGAYDPLIGALVDHLLVIQEHQGDIQAHLGAIGAHQDAIDTALSLLHARLEEVLP